MLLTNVGEYTAGQRHELTELQLAVISFGRVSPLSFQPLEGHSYNRSDTIQPIIEIMLLGGQSPCVKEWLHEPVPHGVCWVTNEKMSNITVRDSHLVLPQQLSIT